MSRKRTAARAQPPQRAETSFAEQYRKRFEWIVSLYVREYRSDARELAKFYGGGPNLGAAIARAAASLLPDDKRHNHQRRIPKSSLEDASKALLKVEQHLGACQNFEDLHQRVEDTILAIPKIGELAVYDIAHRIGAYLKLRPRLVYLHRGTRKGAAKLGFRGKTLKRSDLPKPLRALSESELEDCLCIYEGKLPNLNLKPQKR